MKEEDITLQVGVKILLKNSKGEFLVLLRSRIKYGNFGDMWDIPGGRIIPGTDLIENLRREIKEETGLNYTGIPVLVAAQDVLRHKDKHVVRLTYIGELDGVPVLDDENTEYKWLTLPEMKKMNDLDQYVRELLKRDFI